MTSRPATARPTATTTTAGNVMQLTVTIPASATGGTVAVTVENPAGTSGSLPYTYRPPPVVQRLSTATASVVGGTEVVLTGTTKVTIGKASATSVTVLSNTQLRAVL